MGLTDAGSGSEGTVTIITVIPLLSALRNESLGSPSLHDEELLKLAVDKVSFIFMPIALKPRTHGICQILTILCRQSGKLAIKMLGSAVYEHHQPRLHKIKFGPDFPNKHDDD
jgi:hypothetical protein